MSKGLTYSDIARRFEQRLALLQGNLQAEMDVILFRHTLSLSKAASTFNFRNNVVQLSKYPNLKKRVDSILKELHNDIHLTLVNGIEGAWGLSDQKNKLFIESKFSKMQVSGKLKKQLYDPNLPALNQFINRTENGMNLSTRVWNLTKQIKKDLEQGLKDNIGVGKASKDFQKDLQKYLLHPKGNRNPGRGVYRSPRSNAFRLTRTETNMAYRTADYERWQNQPFVVGVEVVISNNHPDYDICDQLAGKYPKNFLFRGWHPQCRCHTEPILITPDEMDKYEDQILGIGKWNGKSANAVYDAPSRFYKYVEENGDKIARYSSTPYWVNDNPKFAKLPE